MRATGWLWALPLAATLVLATGGCEVCTGDDCDFDSSFDEDGGSDTGGDNDGANDGDDGGPGDNDGGEDDGGPGDDGGADAGPGPDVDVGEEIDLDGDGTPDGEAIDTDDDGKVDGVDVDDDGKVDVPVPPEKAPSLADFCDATLAVRKAWASKFDECCVSSSESGSDEAQGILDLFGREDGAEGCVSAFQTLVRTGKVAFSGKKAQTCAEEYTGLYLEVEPPKDCPGNEGFEYWDLLGKVGKGVPVFAQMESCRAGFSGRLKKDGECTSHFECEAELRCLKASDTRSTCQAPIPSGGECNSTAECDADLICAGETGAGTAGRTCIAKTDLKLNGGGCRASVDCAIGLYCEGTSCAAVPEGVDLTAAGDMCSESFACVGWCDVGGSECAPLCAAP